MVPPPGTMGKNWGNSFNSQIIGDQHLLRTRKVSWPPAGQFSSTCGELVAFGHLEGTLAHWIAVWIAVWISVWRAVLSDTTAVRTELPDLRTAPSLCSISWQRPQLLQLN